MATIELAYDDRGAGTPIVLLHAFPTDRSLWAKVAAEIASDQWRIITPDLRGFGESPLGDDAPDLDAAADDVIALLDRLGIKRAVFGGLSLGGYLTMNIARRYPARLIAVVLADTKAAADDAVGADKRRAVAAGVEAAGTNDALVESWYNTLIGHTSRQWRPEAGAKVRAWTSEAPVATVAWYQRAMADRPDSHDVLRATNVPALVVVGSEDEISPPADAESMRAALPHAVLSVIASSGHLSALEVPSEVATALREFLGNLQ